MTHHGDEMPAGALRGVHEVARALELLEGGLVTGRCLGQLRLPDEERLLARLDRLAQASEVTTNRIQSLPMPGELPAQSLAAPDNRRHMSYRVNPQDTNRGDRYVKSGR